VAGRVADAVVTAGTWTGRSTAFVVVDAAGGGVSSAEADADARPGVSTTVRIRITASVGVSESVGVAASVTVATATLVTNARAATRADAAAEARDAMFSSGLDAASGNAAAGSAAAERRGVHGGICGGQAAVVVAADGVSTGASGRADGGTAATQSGDARLGRTPAGTDGAARSTAGATGSRQSRGATRGKRPRPSERPEVEPLNAAYRKWYRAVSITPEGDALRAHLSAAAVKRVAAAGGAPAGAVGLAISRVLRNGVDRLHAPLRTSSDRTVWEAMDGVVKVVKELRRATFMEDDIGRIVS